MSASRRAKGASGVRILHVSPSYLPATRYGGPIYAVHGLARAQAALGHETHVFTTNIDGKGTSPTPLAVPTDRDGVHVWYFPHGVGRRIFRAPEMARALDRHVPDFDILHAHSVFLWPTSAAARAARKHDRPYVLSPRGMLAPEVIAAKSRLAKSLWINAVGREIVARAAMVHVTSDFERVGVERLGLRVQQFGTAPNGVDEPPGSRPTEVSRPFVLSLGRISWKKGLDRLIESFVHVPDAELVIAGNDDEGLTPGLAELAARLGLTHRVRFVGPAEGDEKWRLMRAATVFALASRSENFANVVLEAMACGVPVVVTPEVGLAETVVSIDAGLVVANEPCRFGAAIASLLADPARRAKCGDAGRQAARDLFSWTAVAQAMDQLYRRALEA